MYFSGKRTIDRLKSHLINIFENEIQENKINQKRIRIWSSNEAEVQEVIKKLTELK